LLLLLLCCGVAACRRPLEPPIRPPAGSAKFLLDSDGVRHEGALVAEVFSWALPAGSSGRLRLEWTSTGPRGEVSLGAALAPPGGGATRLIGRATRRFAEDSVSAAFFEEDWRLPARQSGATLQLRLEPAGAFFWTDLRIVHPDARADAIWLLL